MKHTTLILTLLLTGMSSMTAGAAEGFMVSRNDVFVDSHPVIRLASSVDREWDNLREKWQRLSPEQRDELRRRLKEEGREFEDSFGQGYESRRYDKGDYQDNDRDRKSGSGRWGKSRR